MSRMSLAIVTSVLTCAALAASPAAAVIIINPVDNFGDMQYQWASGPNGSNNTAQAGRTVPVSGGNGLVAPSGRSVFVEKVAGSNSAFMRVEALDDNLDGTFNVSRASGIGGNVLLQWDGGTADSDAPIVFNPNSNLTHLLGGGAGIDLSAGGADGLLIRVLDADLANQTLQLTLFGVNGTVASEQSVILPTVIPPGTFDALFPFAGFSLRAGASSLPNPNAIYAITLAVTGKNGADITLDTLGTYVVPEPAALTMFGLGTAALVATARRVRRRQR